MRRCASWRTSTSPASRSTRRCRDTPGRAIGSSAASSPAVAGPPVKVSSIVRRLSSASARRTASTPHMYQSSYVTVKVRKLMRAHTRGQAPLSPATGSRPARPRRPRLPPPGINWHLPGNPAVVRRCCRSGATMTEPAPRNDFASFPAPAEGLLVAMFITVRKVARSRDFYSRVLGGTVILEENPCTVRLSNSWIIMNPGGPPTPDKPGISVVDYQGGNTTSIFLNLRVADIHACYQDWKAKGAELDRKST